MAEDQEVNAESNAVAGNSSSADLEGSKADERRRHVKEKKRNKNVHICEVRLLDGTELIIEVEVNILFSCFYLKCFIS